MEAFGRGDYWEMFSRFEKPAAKGCDEATWILSVVEGVKMEMIPLKDAFVKTEKPLGWLIGGWLHHDRERSKLYEKSAEGGCSWGQVWFSSGFADDEEEIYIEWLEKAATQKNPEAISWLGELFWEKKQYDEALAYYRAAEELGWNRTVHKLADILRFGLGSQDEDLRQAVVYYAKGDCPSYFFSVVRIACESHKTSDYDYDCTVDQLCYSLGWGLYWHMYGTDDFNRESDEEKAFGTRCLDYYCENVELQQKSIFTFLLCWTDLVGVKDVGVMIAKMVWEGREDNLVKWFDGNRIEIE
jgi:tetratricopeptide (TPR) repeat protein